MANDLDDCVPESGEVTRGGRLRVGGERDCRCCWIGIHACRGGGGRGGVDDGCEGCEVGSGGGKDGGGDPRVEAT